MRFIGQFFGLLWDTARRGNKVNYNRGPAVIYTFLFLIFVVIGLILVALGFDLQQVDVWLNAHSSWFLLIGDILWRGGCALVLLICLLGFSSLVKGLSTTPPSPPPQPAPSSKDVGSRRKRPVPPDEPKRNIAGKLLGILTCVVIGYFAFIGVFWRN